MENTAGYSGTPLAKKLGIKAGNRISVINPPKDYLKLFSDLPEGLKWINDPAVKKDLIHYFTDNGEKLKRDLAVLKNEILVNGIIWISWPKKSSQVPTDLNGNKVKTIGGKIGLVDVKV